MRSFFCYCKSVTWELDYPPPSGPSDFLQHQNYKEDPEYFTSNCSFPRKASAPYAYTNTPIMRVYTWFVLYLYITFLKVSMRTSVIFTWKQLIETQFFEFSVKYWSMKHVSAVDSLRVRISKLQNFINLLPKGKTADASSRPKKNVSCFRVKTFMNLTAFLHLLLLKSTYY
jgi:hypothetical protein